MVFDFYHLFLRHDCHAPLIYFTSVSPFKGTGAGPNLSIEVMFMATHRLKLNVKLQKEALQRVSIKK